MPPIHKSRGLSIADHWSSICRPIIGKVPTKISNVSPQIIKHQRGTRTAAHGPTINRVLAPCAVPSAGSRLLDVEKAFLHGHVCRGERFSAEIRVVRWRVCRAPSTTQPVRPSPRTFARSRSRGYEVNHATENRTRYPSGAIPGRQKVMIAAWPRFSQSYVSNIPHVGPRTPMCSPRWRSLSTILSRELRLDDPRFSRESKRSNSHTETFLFIPSRSNGQTRSFCT